MQIKKFENVGVEAQIDKIGKIDLLHFKKVGEPFSVYLAFEFGALDDNKKGSAHFLEHILLSGTEKYKTKKIMSDEFDKRGCYRNASTGYYSLTLKQENNDIQDLDFAFDMLDQFIFHSIFDNDTLEKERGAIRDEINMYEKEKVMVNYNAMNKNLIQDSRFNFPISGTVETLSTITKEDILNTREDLLNAKKVLVTSGDFDIEKIKIKGKDFLEKLSQYNNENKESKKIEIKKEKMQLTHPLGVKQISIFFERSIYGNDRKIAINDFVYDTLFSNNGLFMERLRYEKGLTYKVVSSSSLNKFLDYFGVTVEARKEDLKEVEEIINKILFEEIYKKITKDNLILFISKTKRREKRHYLNTHVFIREYVSRFLDFGVDMTYSDKYLEILENIKMEEIIAQVKEIFDPKNQATIVFE